MDGFHLQCKAFSQSQLFYNQGNNVKKLLSFKLKHIIVVHFVIKNNAITFLDKFYILNSKFKTRTMYKE